VISNGTVDNLMPILVLIKGLEYLEIGHEVQVTRGGNWIFGVSLVMTPNIVPQSSSELFVEMTAHKSIEDFSMIHVSRNTVDQALEVPFAFSNLQRLRIATQASAVRLLLPKMAHLKILDLKVIHDLSPGETYTSMSLNTIIQALNI
jgi:hypothetical protein